MSTVNQKRLIALMIGLATVTAGLFAWRAGQISSTAAFDDRQSIGNELSVQRQNIEVAVEGTRQARQYDRYVADYAVAEELDEEAAELAAAGLDELATIRAAEAEGKRREATERATDAGVFGLITLSGEGPVTAEPRPFDIERRLASLSAEASTGLVSPGKLDPQAWADEADAIRVRVAGLQLLVLLILGSAILLTWAEVSIRGRPRVFAATIGMAGYVVLTVVGAAGPWS